MSFEQTHVVFARSSTFAGFMILRFCLDGRDARLSKRKTTAA
jgi:hypothetical protein